MKVAIVLSVYKKDKALPFYLAVLSLLHQTYQSIAIFIRLDGEVSHEINRLIKTFQQKYTNIYVSKNDSNYGLSHSLNQLIDIILTHYPQVEFIARMDADDISHLNRIKRQVDFLNQHIDIDVLGTACKEFGIYNKVIIKDKHDSVIKANILKVTPFIHPSVMFRSRIFFEGNRYPQNTVLSEDLAFWLYLSKKSYSFHNLDEVLLFYRIDEETLVRRTGFRKALSELRVRMLYLLSLKNNYIMNTLYILGHFGIRIMPTFIVREIYRLLR